MMPAWEMKSLEDLRGKIEVIGILLAPDEHTDADVAGIFG